MKRTAGPPAGGARGFSLVETMVALIVILVGLIGIAKMQALAMSSTNMARMRSLAALEAASLAAAMHANRGFWAGTNPTGTPPPPTITYTAANGVTGIGTANPGSCAGGCTPAQLAAYDLALWTSAQSGLAGLLPGAAATINCASATPPVNCTISITWIENAVAINQQEAAQNRAVPVAAFNNPTYTLDVEP